MTTSLPRDNNHVPVAGGVYDDGSGTIAPFRVNSSTGALKVTAIGLGTGNIASINGDTTAAQVITGGTGISVSTSAGTTTITNTASGTGTVTSVSVVSANGLAGTVATSTTTPAITLSTSITGLLKGNGTAISAATAGTDYVTASSTNTFTNKTYDTAGTGNSFSINGNAITSNTGSGAVNVLATSPTLVTPILGAATATSINGLTITSSTGTLTVTNAKTLSISNSLTLAGTDSTTMTFPSTSASIARTDAAQTFTGTQTFSQVITTNNAVTVTSNAGTVPVTSKINTFTNSSAATMAITMATASAVDGQLSIVRIYDFSGVAETIGWTNTENSTVSVPTTSNGSTTLPLTVGFQYNSQTSKWRCIAVA